MSAAVDTTQLEMIRDSLAAMYDRGGVVELRIIGTRRGTVSGYFHNYGRMAEAAAEWSGKAPAVYVTLNPVKPALLARSADRLTDYAKQTTADTEIQERKNFGIDFDPARPAGISSTDAEHEAALERAERCREYLASQGWPEPIYADSGNGAHLVYAVSLPNDAATTDITKRCLQALGLMFTDDLVGVDLTTYNASRIWKVYGTVACKGDDLPSRPHRVSRILEAPAERQAVELRKLEELAAAMPTDTGLNVTAGSGSGFDLERWIADSTLNVKRTGEWNGGQKWILNPCPWNAEHTNDSAYIVRFPNGAIAAGCRHNGCAGKNWRDLRDVVEPGWSNNQGANSISVSSAQPDDPDTKLIPR